MELSVVAETLRGEGLRAGVLGLRAYRPFPRDAVRGALGGRRLAIVFDKAVSYGYDGPICSDVRAALAGVAGAPPVMGAVAGLGGRDVTAEKLAAAVRRAVQDAGQGRADRPTEWIDLRLRTPA
jgi:pyruvate/2-oxoacid:ferredoxin oxidoreductase alpha subunit